MAHPGPRRRIVYIPPSERAVVCVVCSGICRPTVPCSVSSQLQNQNWMHPWLIKADEGFWEWCKDPRNAILRHHVKRILPIQMYRVHKFLGGRHGFELSMGGTVGVNTGDSEMYLPIHKACLNVTLEFCKYQSKFDINFRKFSNRSDECGIPSSICHFYEIWMKRALMTFPDHRGILRHPLDEPHDIFGIVLTFDLRTYRRNAEQGNPAVPVQEADPSRNKGTSLAVTRHITRLRRADKAPKDGYRTLKLRIEGLAPELRQMIYNQLGPFKDLNRDQLACARVLPPSWWKEALFGGELFPWLFDTDKRILRLIEKHLRYKTKQLGIDQGTVDEDLDWELLCRRLGQRRVFEEGGVLHGEKNLENRYRIWTLLDSARLGHPISRYSSDLHGR
ncbi:hypothetical protein F4811DRAFT_572509 [Daldinia bambusicola]|nr:hypothetical protein F4811DRAFT_572509 [Daldinia bambusicola]